MDFYEVLERVLALLQQHGRVSYRALKRQFDLDDAYIEDLREELCFSHPVVDEDNRGLVWTQDIAPTQPPTSDRRLAQPSAPTPVEQAHDPLSYTPSHLAEKILTSRGALEGERKQVTVLFADVAGFTSLSAHLEPEDIHTIMDGCFAILSEHVHRYEGTVNQFTGDGIMALFGAPIAREDHAIRAAHAALDIQAAMRDYGAVVQRQWDASFQMRLGLNTGLVVVGRIGDDLRMDYTAQGDTTNLAARMQQMAQAGSIWGAEATYRLASETFEWKSLGTMSVKGKDTPIAVYELRNRWRGHSRFDVPVRRGLTPWKKPKRTLIPRWHSWIACQRRR